MPRPRGMSPSDALKEARRRWGDKAAVRRETIRWMKALGGEHKGFAVCTTCLKPDCRKRYSYVVGRVTYLGGRPFAFTVEGSGHSWENAFAVVDRRAEYAKRYLG